MRIEIDVADRAYQEIEVDALEFGDAVTTIGDFAFLGCPNLREICFGANCERIGFAAFSRCDALESITFPPSISSIGTNAFKDCRNLRQVSFAEGGRTQVTIGNNAFANTPVADVIQNLVRDENDRRNRSIAELAARDPQVPLGVYDPHLFEGFGWQPHQNQQQHAYVIRRSNADGIGFFDLVLETTPAGENYRIVYWVDWNRDRVVDYYNENVGETWCPNGCHVLNIDEHGNASGYVVKFKVDGLTTHNINLPSSRDRVKQIADEIVERFTEAGLLDPNTLMGLNG